MQAWQSKHSDSKNTPGRVCVCGIPLSVFRTSVCSVSGAGSLVPLSLGPRQPSLPVSACDWPIGKQCLVCGGRGGRKRIWQRGWVRPSSL